MTDRSRAPRFARALLSALVVATLAQSAAAEPDRAELAHQEDAARVVARLVVHPEDGAADTRRVGVLLDIAEGWHVYGADAGETGIPTEVRWHAERGTVTPLAWPETTPFGNDDLGYEGMGYAGRVLLPARAAFESEPGTLQAEVSLLACADECIPAEARLSLAPGAPAPSGEEASALRALFGTPAAHAAGAGWRALWLAFLGGLLLNLMPCVLPVLAIKALAMSELSAAYRNDAQRQALAYAAGVLGSLLVLAAAVVALQAGGTAIGWGFQFQEPLYVAGLGALLVLFALNLFGVFEVGAPTGRWTALGSDAVGARRSFFDGLLTVALATPCSAPFLGTAVGFALAGGAAWIVPVFLCIGVGLALPLTLVGFVPAAAAWFPRPGAWMQHFRVGLGFLLLATVTWLAWVLGRQSGVDALVRLLAWLLLVAFLGWCHGVRQRSGARGRGWLAVASAALIVVSGIGVVATDEDPGADVPALPGAREWSRTDVAQALRVGRPALVVFTADWCITCKANERLVLSDPRVHEALAGFEVFVGDWTERDAAIAEELARHGRSGVPFYAIHVPDQRPTILPELLQTDTVLEALARAERAATVSRVTRAAHAGSMQSMSGR